MVRSFGIGLVMLGATCAGLAWSQQPVPAPAAGAGERIITLQEAGKPRQRCRVLQTWHEADGSTVHQVQVLDTRQILTIVETGPARGTPAGQGGVRAITTRIFHWDRNNVPPPGTPMPPQATTSALPPSRIAPLPASPSVGMTTPGISSGTGRVPGQLSGPAVEHSEPILGPNVAATPTAPYSKWPAASPPPPAPPAPPAPSAKVATPRPTPVAPTPVVSAPSYPPPTIITPSSSPQVSPSVPTNAGPRLTPQAGDGGPVVVATPCPACQQKCGSRRGGLLTKGTSDKPCDCGCTTCTPCQTAPRKPTAVAPCPDCPKVQVVQTPSCVAEPAQRPGLFTRLFGSHAPVEEPPPCTPVGTSILVKPGAQPPVVAQSAEPPKTQAVAQSAPKESPRPTEPAEPGDFRESWGQAKPWKPTPPQPEAEPARKAVRTRPPRTPRPDTAKPKPAETDSARADTPPDPIKDPEWYHQKALSALQAKQGPASKSVASAATTDRTRTPAGSAAASDRPGSSPAPGRLPGGMGAPADGPPPFSFATMPANRPPPPPNPYPPSRPVYQQPMPSDVGIPPGMANAFTISTGTTRPIPANFGPPPVAANAFTAPEESQQNTIPSASPGGVNGFSLPFPPQQGPNGAGPAMAGMPGGPMGPMGPMGAGGYGPGMPYGAPGYNPMMGVPQQRPTMLPPQARAPAGPNCQHLMATLKDSLYPSERELAADYLSRQDWRMQPQVVQALMTAAREDPAATVRASCVRALGHMKVNTLPVVTAVQALKADSDPRVRQEVEEALPALGVATAAPADTNVRPASLPEPVAETKAPEPMEVKKPVELEVDKK